MNRRKMIWIAAALWVVGFGIFAVFRADQTPGFRRLIGVPSSTCPAITSPPSSAPGHTSSATAREKTTKLSAAQRLQSARSALQSSASAEESRKILVGLQAYLVSLPPDLAASIITDFLTDPAADSTTKIEFAIDKNGSLCGQPTLRVALLDWLGEIDPQQAGVVAKLILATPTAADEWAVCLRNYARAYPGTDSNDFLHTKTEEMLRNPKWRINPSVGFFESFDVLVHTRATQSTGLLAGLVADRTPESKAIAHAAFLTLDRLTIHEPAAMIQQLTAQPDLVKARPEMVANLIARADLRDATQRQLVRNYILDPTRTGTELTAFAGVYPNANFAISNNLLTENTTLTHAEITARDTAALAIVNTWLADSTFEPVKPHLETMHQRLTTFVLPSTN